MMDYFGPFAIMKSLEHNNEVTEMFEYKVVFETAYGFVDFRVSADRKPTDAQARAACRAKFDKSLHRYFDERIVRIVAIEA